MELPMAVRASVFAAIGAAASFVPSAASSAALECDRPVEEFQALGQIRCGHLTWDLHPDHAARIPDPEGYFERYEAAYRFLETFTGVRPGPISIAERCGPEGEAEACPKGGTSQPFTVLRQGETLYIEASTVGEDLAFAGGHAQQPLVVSLLRELGAYFLPPEPGGEGYLWDPGMRASWADNLALVAFGILNEEARLGALWYSRPHCERGAGSAPCEAFLKRVDQLAALEAEPALAEYEGGERGLDDLVPMPPQGGLARERGLVFTGMLAKLYGEARRNGRGERFLDGLSELVRFYNAQLKAPAAWTEGEQDAELLARKADVFVFLLSASVKRDLTASFAGWRWPVSDLAKTSVKALKRARWDGRTRGKLLSRLLSGAPAAAIPARWGGAGGARAAERGPAAGSVRAGGAKAPEAAPKAVPGRRGLSEDGAGAKAGLPPTEEAPKGRAKTSSAALPPSPVGARAEAASRGGGAKPGQRETDPASDALRRDKKRQEAVSKLVERVGDNGSSEESINETKRILAEMMATANQHVLDRMVAGDARIEIVPKDKKITDIPDFARLKGQKTFDGRPWEDVRGVASGNVCAIPEENMLSEGDFGGYRRFFVLIHEYGHVVQGVGLAPDEPDGGFMARVARFLGLRKAKGPTMAEVENIYERSMEREEKTALGDYADSNSWEMFAQGTAAYFDVGYNGETPDDLKKLNASLYHLSRKVYGPSRSLRS